MNIKIEQISECALEKKTWEFYLSNEFRLHLSRFWTETRKSKRHGWKIKGEVFGCLREGTLMPEVPSDVLSECKNRLITKITSLEVYSEKPQSK